MSTDQEVIVNYNNQDWTLLYTTKSLHMAERTLGKSIMAILSDVGSVGITINEMCTLLFFALRKNHKAKYKSVNELMENITPRELMSMKMIGAITDAYAKATDFGDDDESETKENPLD